MGSVVLVVFLTVDAMILIQLYISFCEPPFSIILSKIIVSSEDPIRTPEQLGPLQIYTFMMVLQTMKTYEKNGIGRVYILAHPRG